MDTVFVVPGAHTYHLCDALARENSKINFITARHEQGAGHMAFGYAKSSGRPGIYTVVPGPGVLNSSSSLSIAYATNSPVLCLTGNIMSRSAGVVANSTNCPINWQLSQHYQVGKSPSPFRSARNYFWGFRQMMSGHEVGFYRGPLGRFWIKTPVNLDVKIIKISARADPDHIANTAGSS